MIGTQKILGATGVHLDTSQGGTKNIEAASVSESGGGVTITFIRPLSATDEHDRALSGLGQVQNFNIALSPGSYQVAYHGGTKGSSTCIIPGWYFFTFVASRLQEVAFVHS